MAHWTPLGEVERRDGRKFYSKCQCSCGLVSWVWSKKDGTPRSGSCWTCASRKHGYGYNDTPEYRAWHSMRTRCNNKRGKDYPRYGGRGIVVCERWDEFSAFLSDMGPRPSDYHSIDRIDNNGPYAPDNCRWATIWEQGRNRRNNTFLTHDGATRTLAEWAEMTGLKSVTIRARLRSGKSAEEALRPI